MAKISICNLSEVFGMAEEQKCCLIATEETYSEFVLPKRTIEYCPLHAAASRMAEVLKGMMALADSYEAYILSDSHKTLMRDAQALIAKIDGRES